MTTPYIRDDFPWERLPASAKQILGNSRELWEQQVLAYSLENQLRWSRHVVRTLPMDDRAYYRQMLELGQRNLLLYPYHLQDVITRKMQTTPFTYYSTMMLSLMRSERSYDSLPNFSAIDCLRLLGIGRNQFIDIMNKCRAKGRMLWRRRTLVPRDVLPVMPIPDIEIEYWWTVSVGYVTEDDVRRLDPEDKMWLDTIIAKKRMQAGELPYQTVHTLYSRDFVFFDVPISNQDQIAVPPLEGFVMNRTTGDYFEQLLYKIFVSIDERTTIQQLAQVLETDIDRVKQAVSTYCRLGFAKRKNVEPLVDNSKRDPEEQFTLWHPSWLVRRARPPRSPSFALLGDALTTTPPPESAAAAADPPADDADDSFPTTDSGTGKRIGFFFDSTLTAFLMMGNLSQGLKNHAVTMFEVGKLTDEALDSFLHELDKVQDQSEGDAQRYFDHAVILRNTLRFLRFNKALIVDRSDGAVDLLRCESVNSLDTKTRSRILERSYALLISMAPISQETQPVSSCLPHHFGPPLPEANSPWHRLFLYTVAGDGPPSVLFVKGTRLSALPPALLPFDKLVVTTWTRDPLVVSGATALLHINDMLTSSPILVQGYTQFRSSTIANFAFPVPDDVLQCPPEALHDLLIEPATDDSPTDDVAAVAQAPIPYLATIHRELGLSHSVGYLRLVQLDDGRWVPLEIVYGIPLFDSRLNQAICRQIEERQLFSAMSLDEMARQTRVQCLSLLHFIDTHQADSLCDAAEFGAGVPFPSVSLLFDGRRLTRLV